MTASGDLVADLDGDGHADQVSDPSRTGARLTIAFGAVSGHRTQVGVRKLAGSPGDAQEDVLAAVADFNRDGWSDLFIVATGAWRGDDPINPSVSEMRLGPFSAAGRGQSVRHLDLGETRGIAVADYNHDHYPDLAAFVYAGDGVYETQARLGSKATRLASDSGKYTVEADRTDDDTPSNMPHSGLSSFHPQCAANGSVV
ncbi:FG-GAP repeat domain-containing protein [Streptomyces sp. CA-135486]|uniref:FG-GAP repeat domain-containing protein n=1 Tax=Streptomyces sp. CA-135486 TaxID=3240049 RepID=UPI003D93B85F